MSRINKIYEELIKNGWRNDININIDNILNEFYEKNIIVDEKIKKILSEFYKINIKVNNIEIRFENMIDLEFIRPFEIYKQMELIPLANIISDLNGILAINSKNQFFACYWGLYIADLGEDIYEAIQKIVDYKALKYVGVPDIDEYGGN